MTDISTVKPLFSMAEFPTIFLQEFLLTLRARASTKCTEHYVGGLNALCVGHTLAMFESENRTWENEDGDLVPAEFPELPVKPTRPQGADATAAALQYYRDDSKLFTDIHRSIAELKQEVLATALGPIIVSELEGLPGGLAEQSLGDILVYLEETYGEPSEEDLNALDASLATPLSVLAGFRAFAPQLKLKITKMEQFGQPVSQLRQMQCLQSATKLFPSITEAIKDYKKSFPTISERSFDGMVAYIRKHVPQLTVADMGWAGHANSTAPAPHAPGLLTISDLVAEILPMLLQHMNTTAHAATSPAGRGHGPAAAGRGLAAGRGRGGGRGGRGGRGVAQPYCFEHGYRGHIGEDCSVMTADPTYTSAMKKATAPCTIDGYHGSTRK
jgi:hypothetical protein